MISIPHISVDLQEANAYNRNVFQLGRFFNMTPSKEIRRRESPWRGQTLVGEADTDQDRCIGGGNAA
ncbi:MAG TPA: hypothetical protein VGY66_06140 [Gemmataceae bacterium]|jgi:hypothetical protein|nr:hypothetical protein [Gemmataceae bacterium]